jgi:hypothetical protein
MKEQYFFWGLKKKTVYINVIQKMDALYKRASMSNEHFVGVVNAAGGFFVYKGHPTSCSYPPQVE